MPKRDYKSYNILEKTLDKYEENIQMDEQSEIEEKKDMNDSVYQEDVNQKIDYSNVVVEETNQSLHKGELQNTKKARRKIELKKIFSTDFIKGIGQDKLVSNGMEKKSSEVNDIRKNNQLELNLNSEVDNDVKEGRINKENFSSSSERHQDNYFPKYKSYYQQKERSILFKGLMAIAKTIIALMLLPFVGAIAFIAFGIVALVGTIIGVCLVGGLFILASICFMSSQISSSLIWLGISASTAMISLSGIIFILCLNAIKWLIGQVKRYKKSHIRVVHKEAK